MPYKEFDFAAADQTADAAFEKLNQLKSSASAGQLEGMAILVDWIKEYALDNKESGRQGAGYKRLIQPLIGVGRHQR